MLQMGGASAAANVSQLLSLSLSHYQTSITTEDRGRQMIHVK